MGGAELTALDADTAMTTFAWSALLLVPVVVSCVYWIATDLMMARFFRRRAPADSSWLPAVSLIKPVCGLEKNIHENLSTACRQNYPRYEVIFSVQDSADPALPLLARIRGENPTVPIQIVVDRASAGPNGKVSNLLNATGHATGRVLVYSDSDMRLEPNYLRTIVAPLANPRVGIACTVYRAEGADNLYESLELLSLNTDFVPSMVFAVETGAALACPGASQAIRRETLTLVGGLEPMAYSLVEDLELGRAVMAAGLMIALVPHVAVTRVDAPRPSVWWRHQVYWDQNTRVANPVGFFFTFLVRGVPFAGLYALCGGPGSWRVLAGTLAIRLGTPLVSSTLLGDREGIRRLWLLPLRDAAGLLVWLASFVGRKVYWRGRVFALSGKGLIEV
jgi:ceramide glucosyltransferase